MGKTFSFYGAILILGLVLHFGAEAQTTAFNYQGSLNSGGTPANGNHDFEFALFDMLAAGTQLGSTLTRSNVVVTNGVFSVSLDFGNQFPGTNRFLEIRVRPAGQPGITVLSPRQQIISSPYSLRSLVAANAGTATTATNATQLGGVAANQYVLTNDPRMTDARNPLPGSGSYIQNQNAAPQASSNFTISGNGTTGGTLSGAIVNASAQYNLSGIRILRQFGVGNLFIGFQAGEFQTDSNGNNTFVGQSAGRKNISSFSEGSANAFFGFGAGGENVSGNRNSFFGHSAGGNGTGSDNSFFGQVAGSNTAASGNSFFGSSAGRVNTTGANNSFFGKDTGLANTTGSNNTIIGAQADVAVGDLTNATAIGNRAFVAQSNSLVLGSINGVNGATSNTRVGIGTTAPEKELHVRGPGAQEIMIESSDVGGVKWSLQSSGGGSAGRFEIINRTAGANRFTILSGGNVGIGTTTPDDKLEVVGSIRVSVLGVAGPTPLCRNASNQISLCSSSGRYKSNIDPFSPGLSLIRRLRPVSFNWKEGGTLDLGLVAEDVAKVEPLLTITNDKGEIEGVKYDRVGVVLVNAVQEQQAQIETQQKVIREQSATIVRLESEIDEQRSELIALKSLICSQNPKADICSPRK